MSHKNYITLFLLFLTINIGWSQSSFTSHKTRSFKTYLTGTLIVELSGNDKFDRSLKDAVRSVWWNKKYEFKTKDEVEMLDEDHSVSVLGVYGVSTEYGLQTAGYSIYIPGKDPDVTRMSHVIAYVPITCSKGGGI